MDNEIIKMMRKAVKAGDICLVKEIVENNEEILKEVTPFGTWLHVAATYGKIDIVRYLIEEGIDINQNGDIAECGAIKSAASKGNMDIVQLLYQHGAKLDVSEASKNPLFGAIYGGYYDVAKFLIDCGIDIKVKYNTKTLKDVDAYEYARQFGRSDIVEYLKAKLNK